MRFMSDTGSCDIESIDMLLEDVQANSVCKDTKLGLLLYFSRVFGATFAIAH